MYVNGDSGFVGKQRVLDYYASGNEIMNAKKLEIMSEVLPGVENTPAFYGIGDLVIRLQTTPYIVIADDCKTASKLKIRLLIFTCLTVEKLDAKTKII